MKTARLLLVLAICFVTGVGTSSAQVGESQPVEAIASAPGKVAKKQKPRIRGVVTFQIAPGFVFVQDKTGAICVHVRKRMTMAKGDVVDMVVDNFSTKGDWFVSFNAAVTGKAQMPEAAAVRPGDARPEKHHAAMVKMTGRVISQSQSTNKYYVNEVYVPVTYEVLTAECDGAPVRMAFLPGSDVLDQLPVGTVAEFTGAARIEPKKDSEETSIALWVDGPGAVRVLEAPPFWSSPRIRRWLTAAGLVLLAGVMVFGLGLVIQRRKLKMVRASEERFRALVDNSFELTVVLDAGGRLKYLTPAAERLFGSPGDNGPLHDGEFKALVHPDDRSQVKQARDEVLRTPGSTARIANYRMITREGEVRHAEAVGTNCLDVRGVEGIVMNIRDVTDRKVAEETLRRSNADLEQRVAERTEELHRALAHERELGQMKSNFVSQIGRAHV